MEELNPCPFCGSEGVIRHREIINDFIPECANPFCIASYMIGNSFDTEEEAIATWNQRKEGGK